MNVLIIGSKGFIGSHLLFFLRSNGHTVYGSDLIADYSDPHYFHFDPEGMDFNKIFSSVQFDFCLNCSGSASVPYSYDFPQSDFHLNSTNVFAMLDALRSFQSNCRFIHFSSAAVYGQPEDFPITEKTIESPISVYGYNKWISEIICREFFSIYNVPVAIVRIFSAYGEGLKKQLFWDLYQKLKNEAVVELFGTGQETRDFIHINDVVTAIYLIMQNGDFDCSIYNVANGEKQRIKNVVELFFKVLNSSEKFSFKGEARMGDPSGWEVDISKLKALGYSPQISMENGLKRYAEWVKEL